MADILENVSDEQLKESFEILKRTLSGQLLASMDLKESEQKLKDDIVQENQFYKKDNVTPDYGKIKMPLLKSAIDINMGGEDKLAKNLDMQDQYLSDIKNKKISPAAVDGFARKTAMLAEAKTMVKDTKENMKTVLDAEIVEALFMLAENDIENEKDRLDAEGGESKKQKKDDSGLLALAKAIKAKLKK